MSSEFESGFFGNREPAWHVLGTVIDEDVVTAARAIKLAKLEWRVEKAPLIGIYAMPDGSEMEIDVPEYFATVRNDTLAALGVVGRDYTPLQNDELFGFMEALCDDSIARAFGTDVPPIFHTAGSLRGGRHVWACAKLPKTIQVLGMEDENVLPYLMTTNAHDGTRAFTAVMTPIRTVCMNTLTLALSRAVRAWTIRHTPGITDRVATAQEALGIAFRYMDAFEKAANGLVKAKLPRKDFDRFLEQLVPYDEEMLKAIQAGEPNRAAKNVDEAREVIASLYVASPNLQNVKGTKWAALNAVAEYEDFARPQRTVLGDDGRPDQRTMNERRFVRIVWQGGLKQQALRLLEPKLAHSKGDNLEALARA